MGNELREQDNHKQMRTITWQSRVAQLENFLTNLVALIL